MGANETTRVDCGGKMSPRARRAPCPIVVGWPGLTGLTESEPHCLPLLTSACLTVPPSLALTLPAEPRAATAPQLAERSVSLEARRDETLVIPCLATGHPPPEYR